MKYFFSILLSFFFLSSHFYGQETCLLDLKKEEINEDLVQDYADILSDSQEKSLRDALISFNDSVSTQILILTVKNLCGYDKAEFTYTLAEKWRVGQKGKDNGIVIMVKPKEVDGKGEAYIATGYGLEGVLPDATAKRIVTNEMIPFFKQKDYFSGIAKATNTVMNLTAGEFTAEEYEQKANNQSIFPIVLVLIIFLIFGIFQVMKAKNYAQTNNLSFWAAWALINASRNRHTGTWGDFNSGGGSFGGGGFGGFGGGSFGGGGAGGSW